MFHAPSFFAALSYHPTDPGFPVRSVLHMMCAIGSMYTSSFPIGSVIESYPCKLAPDPVFRVVTHFVQMIP